MERNEEYNRLLIKFFRDTSIKRKEDEDGFMWIYRDGRPVVVFRAPFAPLSFLRAWYDESPGQQSLF